MYVHLHLPFYVPEGKMEAGAFYNTREGERRRVGQLPRSFPSPHFAPCSRRRSPSNRGVQVELGELAMFGSVLGGGRSGNEAVEVFGGRGC